MSGTLIVDLDDFEANLTRVRDTVAPASLMLVVKDDAYQHGLEPIVMRAWHSGVRWFGAFDVYSGVRVRRALGDGCRIFVWIAASAAEIEAAIANDLDMGIGEAGLLDEVAEAAGRTGRRVRVHLKIDTGLHRNGVRPEEWGAFTTRAAGLAAEGLLDVVGIWSHISEASDDDDDQAHRVFEAAVGDARRAGLTPHLLHFAASAASFARPEFRHDLVRVGAFCYGIRPAGGPDDATLGIRPIARWESRVIAVGNATATIDVGSLQGLPSSLAGRVDVGTPCGTRRLLEIGAESTVESWPGAAIGDIVTVYGPGDRGEQSATDLAEAIDTIGEEIALRVSPLVPRHHRSR